MIFPDMLLPPVYILDYSTFDKLVAEHLDWPDYNFVAQQETNNDTSHLYTDITKNPKYEWDVRDRDELLVGDRKYKGPHDILLALVYKDILPEGNYIINVSW